MSPTPALSIGEVARRAGVAASAIRYYEGIGLLPAPARAGGKRRYDERVLDSLALIALARDAGLTMAETRELVAGFAPGTPPAERWRAIATRKLAELDALATRVDRMRAVLGRTLECECARLEECGHRVTEPARRPPDGAASDGAAGDDAPPAHVPTRGLYGWITHTELASTDPGATRAWCAAALGWEFRPPLSMDGAEYHLFAYAPQGGGGIHRCAPGEAPGSVPFVHVEDARASFDAAVREGAEPLMPPARVMEGVTLAMVRAPGGVTIGLSGP